VLAEEEYPVHPQIAVRQVLMLALLMTLVVLAMSACGGAEEGGGKANQGGGQGEGVKDRPLPQDPQALPPSEYHSVDFEPSLSFTLGKGWLNTESQLPDFIEVGQPGETGWISFANVKEVFKPGTHKVVEAPEDLVGWLRKHPYLQTSRLQPVTVGGVEGEQFDLAVEAPEGYYGACGSGCVDVYSLSGGEPVGFEDGVKTRIIVYEDVKGETVANDIGVSDAGEFDEFMNEAKKVLDTVKWGG
jgi:hypothetical protein